VRQILDKNNCFLSIHVAEDLQSEELVKAKWGGKNSVQLLKKFNLFSPNTNLVHCGVAREEELLLAKEAGSQITVCPISSNTLQTPYANPITLETMGIDWHIASDGLAQRGKRRT
jgi:cytosine/adenosine deaminase-related metal-dependent hydrolase